MSVAEEMCDFIFMIYKGKKVLDGTLKSIQQKYGSDTLHVRAQTNGRGLSDLPGVLKVTDQGNFQELRLSSAADSQQILAALMQRGRVDHFELAHPSLHDIFVRIASPDPKDATQTPAKEIT
jgi:ABC-2 type transport system ATP-binding protein